MLSLKVACIFQFENKRSAQPGDIYQSIFARKIFARSSNAAQIAPQIGNGSERTPRSWRLGSCRFG